MWNGWSAKYSDRDLQSRQNTILIKTAVVVVVVVVVVKVMFAHSYS